MSAVPNAASEIGGDDDRGDDLRYRPGQSTRHTPGIHDYSPFWGTTWQPWGMTQVAFRREFFWETVPRTWSLILGAWGKFRRDFEGPCQELEDWCWEIDERFGLLEKRFERNSGTVCPPRGIGRRRTCLHGSGRHMSLILLVDLILVVAPSLKLYQKGTRLGAVEYT